MTPVTGHETDDGPAQHDEGRGEPVWQPASRVGPWTLMVLEQLAHSRDMWATLEQARPTRPGAAVLDDATVSRTREVYGQMARDYRELYAAQARRWRACAGRARRADAGQRGRVRRERR